MTVQLKSREQQAADDANEASRGSTDANPANGQDAPVSQDEDAPVEVERRGRRAQEMYLRHRTSPMPLLTKRGSRFRILASADGEQGAR